MVKLEFDSICRLCVRLLEKGKASPLFNNVSYNDKISLPDRIKYCSSVQVTENDGLPLQICSSCLSKLNQSFNFRNQCILADKTLKQLKSVDCSISELNSILKLDIENQIIKTEKDIYQADSPEFIVNDCELIKNLNIDEFDNRKNGRHIKTVNKSKEIPFQRVKSSNRNNVKIYVADWDTYRSQKAETAQNTSAKNLREDSKQFATKDSKAKTKNQKETRKKEKGSSNEQELNFKNIVQEEIKVEPDVFIVNDNDQEISQNHDKDSNSICSQIKSSKKVEKRKSLDTKKNKSKKSAKEKPSSYTCEYCKKVYPSEGGWRYHIYTIHNENYQPFICDLCGQSFKVKKNLEAHKNSIHFHLKLHLCDLCGREFASKYALKVHKIWHNDEKNFSCDICGTKFRTRGKMNTHRSIHGGPKNFMCHICSKEFRWKKDFEIHMRTHTGEKPFKCSHCGKAFASVTNMKKHEGNHIEKMAAPKKPTTFDLAETTNERLYKNDLLNFTCETEDVRHRQSNQI